VPLSPQAAGEWLFHLPLAEGDDHPAKDDVLSRVSRIRGLSKRQPRRLCARFVPDAKPDPYDVLGVTPDTLLEAIRPDRRTAVRASHPDRMTARGLLEDAVKLAEKRLIPTNATSETIQARAG